MDGFFPEGSFFAAVAFTSPTRRGNPTGVVLAHPEWGDRTCQRIAAELGFPDTVFLQPGAERDAGVWRARFFSPAQPLSLCVQALIAAGAVLARSGEVTLLTETGAVRVHAEEGRHWARFPKEAVREVASPSGPLGPDLPDGPARVIDSGRVRRFQEVDGREALAALSLAPSDVLSACERHKLQGLCFWTRVEERAVALRVFTPSLDGGEDASTGGAVLGLSALLPAGTWRVEQGAGAFHRQGELWLRAGEVLEVGGAVRVIASGMLADL